jgi:CRISPR-associated endonuclease/helicase Cas3
MTDEGIAADRLMALWAKERGCEGERYHPLPYHLLDVAAVAEAVWDEVLTSREREDIAEQLGLTAPDARRWVSFLAGVHDVGKASVAFQLDVESQRPRLRDAGFWSRLMGGERPHGDVSAHVLSRALYADFAVDRLSAETLAVAVGGHHGVFQTKEELGSKPKADGAGLWAAARQALLELLAAALEVPRDRPPRADFATAMWVAGFVSVVDWIGSNTRYFPCAAEERAIAPAYDRTHLDRARTHAREALDGLGWLARPPSTVPSSFEEMFNKSPNAMQQSVIGLDERLNEPGLVIIEAPMGSGKTEAGLWLAQQWGVRLGQRGFYIALPTQATSDQMFDRVTEYLRVVYAGSDGVANVQLLHGHAALSSAFEALKRDGYHVFAPSEVGEGGSGERLSVAAAEWFTYRKRGLLAPFGVGTVDQALLAVLQTHHVFVRLFGLAHRTAVIDEVHAYDAYMSTLLEQLLTWLAALGASAVLLSATLPDSRRRALADAYLRGGEGGRAELIPEARYPRLTVAGAGHGLGAIEVAWEGEGKTVKFDWVPILPANGEFPLGARLEEALREGGTAAVICNTVGRAQRVYELLEPHFPGESDDEKPELDLLHARYPWEERAERERRSLVRFGKEGVKVGGEVEVRRPWRAVLVATQVIEQSLDLDFDLMVTDLAPVDLILQRSGRLHRHAKRTRPRALKEPWLWIGQPEEEEDGSPSFDPGSEKVYFPHVLIRTWLALRGRDGIEVPADVEPLVEAVYGDGVLDGLPEQLRRRWAETLEDMEKALAKERIEARKRYIRRPRGVDHLWELAQAPLEEEAPELHPGLQALTRLTEPAVTAVLLGESPAGPALDGKPVDLGRGVTLEDAAALLRRSVSLSDRRVVYTLLDERVPDGWQKSPLLRTCRALVLGPDGRCVVGKHVLRLDADLGVVIE